MLMVRDVVPQTTSMQYPLATRSRGSAGRSEMRHRSMGVAVAAAWVVVAGLAAYPAGQAPAPIKEAVLGK
jgi:hypothetical protein